MVDQPENPPDQQQHEQEQTIRQSSDSIAAAIDLSQLVIQESGDVSKVPGYALGALLGEGSFGQVRRAVQVRTQKDVAVKLFTARTGLDWMLL